MSDTVESASPPAPPRRRLLIAIVSLLLIAAAGVVATLLSTNDEDTPGDGEPEPIATSPPWAPDELEPDPALAPGTLIRSSALTTGVPANVRSWRILYATTDADGDPVVSTGLVFAAATASDGPRPVLGLAHGTRGITTSCAASLSSNPFAGVGAGVATLIDDGWVAVASDYAGLGTRGPHPYLVGPAEAHNVLDAVRAAHQLLNLSAETILWGYSQGGHAALWAGIEAPTYAPELDLLGVAATAPPTDLQDLLSSTRSSLGGTLVSAYVLASWSQVYPEAELEQLVPTDVWSAVTEIGTLCSGGPDAPKVLGLASSIVGAVPESAYDGELGRLLRENTPTANIAAPVLVGQGALDEVVLPDVQRAWVAQRCAQGQAIDYREFPGLTHTSLMHPASPFVGELVQWARDRLAGKPARGNCR